MTIEEAEEQLVVLEGITLPKIPSYDDGPEVSRDVLMSLHQVVQPATALFGWATRRAGQLECQHLALSSGRGRRPFECEERQILRLETARVLALRSGVQARLEQVRGLLSDLRALDRIMGDFYRSDEVYSNRGAGKQGRGTKRRR